MRNKKVKPIKKTIDRKHLAQMFPYHLPNPLTEDELTLIQSKDTSKEDLAVIYSRVFNSDNSYSEKRHNQLKRIAKEYK